MQPEFQDIFISQNMTLLADDKQGPLTCVAIAAGNNHCYDPSNLLILAMDRV